MVTKVHRGGKKLDWMRNEVIKHRMMVAKNKMISKSVN